MEGKSVRSAHVCRIGGKVVSSVWDLLQAAITPHKAL